MRQNRLFLILFFFVLPPQLMAQNIVMEVNGTVTQQGKGTAIIKKGDELASVTHLQFTPDGKFPRPEIKLLTPKGIALIRYGDYQQHAQLELASLIAATIHHNSVATLGTRGIHLAPTAAQQVHIVDSLCGRLQVSPVNIEAIVSTFINPYCISVFEKPDWAAIGALLHNKYGLNFYSQTGNNLSAAQYNAVPKLAKVTTRDILPGACSLKKYCPTPGDQGNFGTCVGWASAYGVRTMSWAIRNNDTVTSDINNQAFSPTYVYEQIKSGTDANCQLGASTYDAVALLKKKGAPFLSELSFGCGVNIVPFAADAQNYAIKDYYGLTRQYGVAQNETDFRSNLENIKRALAAKKPVLGTIVCYSSFGGAVWNGIQDVNRGGHAICIVGYDDHFFTDDGAVEVMNSWGPYWGNGGFIYVRYRDLKNILTSAIALYDDAAPAPLKPEPDKPLPPPIDPTKYLQGALSLQINDGSFMQVKLADPAHRGLQLVNTENMTYEVPTAYSSGTQFKINFTSDQPAYVYLIASDSKKSELSQLFPDPDSNFSPLLDFNTKVGVSLPEGSDYIAMDSTPGEDYLCILYSKDPLDMPAIRTALSAHPEKGFVKTIKAVLGDRIIADGNIRFEADQIAFKAASKDNGTVPVFIKFKHI